MLSQKMCAYVVLTEGALIPCPFLINVFILKVVTQNKGHTSITVKAKKKKKKKKKEQIYIRTDIPEQTV